MKRKQPKIVREEAQVYFVEDGDRVRVGQTDWPGDTFNIVSRAEFEVFQKICQGLNMPLLDKTYED